MPLLALKNISIGYDGYFVQSNLSLQADEGSFVCLLGTNGCGKSTLLRTIAGLLPPLAGEIVTGNADHGDLHAADGKTMAVVLTDRMSADRTTVHDVVAMGRYPYTSFLGTLTRYDEDVITEALQCMDMFEKSKCFFNHLSDGEKQRALIAKALAQQTPFILLDEPTAHLDLPNRIKTLVLLRKIAHNGPLSSGLRRTIIISTHELDLALQTADIVWLMTPHGGIEVGSPDALVCSGRFQQAFSDPLFTFENTDGRLQLKIN